jgi:hypothetical protein
MEVKHLKDGWYTVHCPCAGFVFRELKFGYMYKPDGEIEDEIALYINMIIKRVEFVDIDWD